VKISIDKTDHNSRVGVMYYLSVEKILACFPNAALLYQVNTVRLNQFNGSNRYKIHYNICIVGALTLSQANIAPCNCLVGRSVLGVGSHVWLVSIGPAHWEHSLLSPCLTSESKGFLIRLLLNSLLMQN
jgi:hypothetical protein